ncbi:hypothetical protein JX265_013037 [Neoarthrinium moseri]|uniref:Rhodopsin domain-containing protein n=1 Tax=Neoarthrinium moseri TaxID=1658444 RepID=A0A9P9W9P3_9PEZI|nr:uncharacterized protein JN550_005816 [Neoarthrinium moseri]KAI1840245.1 hypothetical protein JX266_013556 [Neoarthrinium moseri]KAI1852184.1 hypothetical protein JX265_013037 [Neoarthrinium moseri]KAI1869186.1 hypothetical protein JN550_005816 [Neoarthrinium moseri]
MSAMSSSDTASENKGPSIVAAVSTVTALSTVFVAARVYTKAFIVRQLHLDDYLIVLSVVAINKICGWLSAGFSIAAVQSGNGRHFDTLTLEQKSGAILYTMVGFSPGVFSFGLPKLSAVALLTRILNPSKAHKIFLWVMSCTCVVALSICIALLFGQCTPSRAQWDFSITEKTCWSPWILVHYSMFAGLFSAACDLYLAVYPAIVLYKLQMNRKKKIVLSGALGLGSISTIVAIYKTTRLPSLASSDFSYDTSDLVVWTCTEGSTIIIATCIPVLRPLVDLVLGRDVFGSSRDRRKYKNYGSERSGSNTHPNNIELGSNRRAFGHSGSYNDPTMLTECDKVGSQESILPLDGPKSSQHGQANAIVRTQSVMVSYDENEQHPKSHNWP